MSKKESEMTSSICTRKIRRGLDRARVRPGIIVEALLPKHLRFLMFSQIFLPLPTRRNIVAEAKSSSLDVNKCFSGEFRNIFCLMAAMSVSESLFLRLPSEK